MCCDHLVFVFVYIGRIIFRLVSPRMIFGDGVVIDLLRSPYRIDLVLAQRLRGKEYCLSATIASEG